MAMLIDLSTFLDAEPDTVWAAVKKPETFEYITRGLVGATVEGAPEGTWAEEGRKLELRLRVLNVLPSWQHTIEIETVDEERRMIQTREHGGPVKRWNHRITVDHEADGTRYRDHVEIDAGAMTPIVWSFAQGLYRYRQARWRRLAPTLTPAGDPGGVL